MLLRSVGKVAGSTVAAVDAAAVADDLTIRRVLAEYCHCVDDGRFDDLVELFSAAGEFWFGSFRPAGRDGVRAWFDEYQPPELRGKHLTSNIAIRVDGDEAAATSDFVFLTYVDGALTPSITGRYVDELERSADGWLIRRREAVLLRPPR